MNRNDGVPEGVPPRITALGHYRRFERYPKPTKPERERLTLDLHKGAVNALFRIYCSYYGNACHDHRFKAFCESVMLSAIEFEERILNERNMEIDFWLANREESRARWEEYERKLAKKIHAMMKER
jgi:hypothetical protein